MNRALVPANLAPNSMEQFSGLVFSRVIYDNKSPVMLLMSVTEALRLRRADAHKLNALTAKAKRSLENLNGKG